ncbi:YTH domain-containing protein 1-like [Asparagus officinalis]|uniref:YTH domain-containing protein 1-like n=1 Tax=Asparagus officinalis TaxID=4686 RepID=UPI00098E4CBD|nr:YTH domain-containing protein 1-like [Asparagus officinalis]
MAIEEAHDLSTLTLDGLIGKLEVHEKKVKEKEEAPTKATEEPPKKSKSIALKGEIDDSSSSDSHLAKDCPKLKEKYLKYKKKKAMYIGWDESEPSDSDNDDEGAKIALHDPNICFMAHEDEILAQHIRDAFESEDEIEKLTTEDQIQFWRNTAKINWKLLHTVKRNKRLQWEECSKEIHRLNKKLERYEGTADLIDPEDLKKNVKGIMSQKEGHIGSAQKKIRRSIDSEDRGDDGICFDYDEVTNIGKEAEKELEKGEWQEMEDDNLEKAVESEEDKKEEATVDEKKEEEQEQEKNEEEEEEEEKVEEEKHPKKDEEIVVENREGELSG